MDEPTTCEFTGCGVSPAPLGWMPPRFAWVVLGIGMVSHLVFRATPVFRSPELGIACILVGLWMAIAAKKRFRQLGLLLPPQTRPRVLLSDGWFGISRNPMYVGMAIFLLGAGLLVGSLPAMLPAPMWVVRRWCEKRPIVNSAITGT